MSEEYLSALKQVFTNLTRINIPIGMLESVGVPVYNSADIVRQIIDAEIRKQEEAAKKAAVKDAPLEEGPIKDGIPVVDLDAEPVEINE